MVWDRTTFYHAVTYLPNCIRPFLTNHLTYMARTNPLICSRLHYISSIRSFLSILILVPIMIIPRRLQRGNGEPCSYQSVSRYSNSQWTTCTSHQGQNIIILSLISYQIDCIIKVARVPTWSEDVFLTALWRFICFFQEGFCTIMSCYWRFSNHHMHKCMYRLFWGISLSSWLRFLQPASG